MQKGFPTFSYEQHQVTGQQIYSARMFFGELHINLAESYGESAQPAKLVESIIRTIDSLRTSLDEVLCVENPDLEDWELNQCYYSVDE